MPLRTSASAVLLACVLAGCSTTTGGNALPSSSSGDSTAPGASTNPNVPKVASPITVPQDYLGDPCKAVPPALLTEMQFTKPGKPHTDPASIDAKAGPACTWTIVIGAQGLGLSVAILTGNRDRGIGGLAGLYTGKDSGQVGFVEPGPDVEGYPAVYSDARDRRADGDCVMFVGIADDLDFNVGATGYQGQQDSCDAAQKVAAAVVKTLKGA